MGKYDSIENYLKFITENYRLDIVINDFSGFLSVDSELAEVFKPYLIHKNPFCMYVKSNNILWDRCLGMKRGILIKSQNLKEAYFGMCFCGVGEYILPVICNNIVIGVISAGEFQVNDKLSDYRIRKISKAYGMNYDEMISKFKSSARKEMLDKKLVITLLGIVCELLSGFYSTLISTHKEINLKRSKLHSSEDYILSHAVEFIHQNYCENVSVKDISTFCHCSESYINHIFKKNLKVNIRAYINKLKVEQSKTYLLNTDESISEISLKVGFADPNYFSSVFSKIAGISPKVYRKRFAGNQNTNS